MKTVNFVSSRAFMDFEYGPTDATVSSYLILGKVS
jgi:hypothetical protein